MKGLLNSASVVTGAEFFSQSKARELRGTERTQMYVSTEETYSNTAMRKKGAPDF